jgi:Arc/MetJ-type ribon-helix-helix transcriptional regulator
MKKEETKLISLRCPADILKVIEEHTTNGGFSNRTDAIIDLIQRGSGQEMPTSAVAQKANNVIQPEEYVSQTDLQELESDLYTRLSDQLNGLLDARLGESAA